MQYKTEFRGEEHMAYRTDTMRLRDGAKAIKTLSEPEPETLDQLEAQLSAVMDGALALQSLDDLGSSEANEAAWSDMLRLQKRGDVLQEKIKAFKTAK